MFDFKVHVFWGVLLLLIFAGLMACRSGEVEAKNKQKHDVILTNLEDTLVQSKDTLMEFPTTHDSSSISMSYLMGQFDPVKDPRFVRMEKRYAQPPGLLLRREAYEAFKRMADAAAKEGIQLVILSATRNFARQKTIWEEKWTGARLVDGQKLAKTIPDPVQRAQKILEWSSMPGSSRHHWGTDIDINAFENSYFAKGRGKKEYDWLQANAARFDFCQPYSPKDKDRPHGYNEEKWHWSYLPLSTPLTQYAEKHLRNEMIQGFQGAETAPPIDIVRNYVLGINPTCKH